MSYYKTPTLKEAASLEDQLRTAADSEDDGLRTTSKMKREVSLGFKGAIQAVVEFERLQQEAVARRKAALKRLRQEEAARLLAKQRAAYALRVKQGAAFPLNSTRLSYDGRLWLAAEASARCREPLDGLTPGTRHIIEHRTKRFMRQRGAAPALQLVRSLVLDRDTHSDYMMEYARDLGDIRRFMQPAHPPSPSLQGEQKHASARLSSPHSLPAASVPHARHGTRQVGVAEHAGEAGSSARGSSPPPHRREGAQSSPRAALRHAGVVTPAAEGPPGAYYVPRSPAVNLPMRVAPRFLPWHASATSCSTAETVEATAPAQPATQGRQQQQQQQQRTAERSAEHEGAGDDTSRALSGAACVDHHQQVEVERSVLRERLLSAGDPETQLAADVWPRLNSAPPEAQPPSMAARGHGAQPPPHTQRQQRRHHTRRRLTLSLTCAELPPLLPVMAPPKPPTPRNDRAGELAANPSPCTAAAMTATLYASLTNRDRALRAMLHDRGEATGEVVEGLPFVRLRPSRDWELAAVQEMLAAERCARASAYDRPLTTAEGGGGGGGGGGVFSSTTISQALAKLQHMQFTFTNPRRIGLPGDVGSTIGPASPRRYESQSLLDRWIPRPPSPRPERAVPVAEGSARASPPRHVVPQREGEKEAPFGAATFSLPMTITPAVSLTPRTPRMPHPPPRRCDTDTQPDIQPDSIWRRPTGGQCPTSLHQSRGQECSQVQ